jgi:glycosyltransferase involved in cell wall biosynthesis
MTKSSIFISTNLSKNTGGGGVSRRELEALQKHTQVKMILANHKELDYPIVIKSMNPLDYHQPNTPFMWDYLASELLDQRMMEIDGDVDILFINGNPFGKTVDKFVQNAFFFKENPETTVITDVPAHDLRDSIQEHHNLGINYEAMYPHMVDEFLLDMQTKHVLESDIIICPSNYSVSAMQKLDLVSDQQFEVIPHGVDLPDVVKPIPEQFRVGYVGQCGPDKGVIYACMAWKQLNYKDSIFGYAGPHEEVWKHPANGWIKRIMPESQAQFKILGFIPEISELYNNISVYIQPSVTEGFGLEVLEAMAHGRPVIVSDGCGASELVDEGKNGFIFEKRDTKKLAELINWCKENPDSVKQMGKNARQKAENYKWSIIGDRYAKLFE